MELIQRLKHLPFPECSQLALKIISTSSSSSLKHPSSHSSPEDILFQISEQYIFGIFRNTNVNKGIKEFQLINITLNHFESLKGSNVTLFKVLFRDLVETKIKFLIKLFSTAIFSKNKNLLDTASLWMEMIGLTSRIVCSLISSILIEHCPYNSTFLYQLPLLGKDGVEKSSFFSYEKFEDFDFYNHRYSSAFSSLPSVSPLFSCCSLITLSHLLNIKDKSLPLSLPLLNLVLDWLELDPMVSFSLLHRQLISQPTLSLEDIINNQYLLTPLPFLVSFSLLSSIQELPNFCESHFFIKDRNNIINFKLEKKKEFLNKKWRCVWWHLHSLLLSQLSFFSQVNPSNKLSLLPVDLFFSLISQISKTYNQNNVLKEISKEAKEEAGDKVVQIVQISLSSGAFRCSLSDLEKICSSLPQTRLCKVVRGTHLGAISHSKIL